MAATPRPVEGLFDQPMWESIRARNMRLQCCAQCGCFRYPPAPICSRCLEEQAAWVEICGRARIVSWVIFHRPYLAAYQPPYNAIAVRLEEGPIMISNLVGAAPAASWIGAQVRMMYSEMPDGMVLPRFILA